MIAQLLARSGTAPIVVGSRRHRLALAEAAGAAEVVDARDPVHRAELGDRITAGGLAPVSIDATGTGEGLGLALGTTVTGGLVVVYSIYRNPETVPNLDLVYRRELTLVGSRGAGGRWDEALQALEDRVVDPIALTADPVPLEQGPDLLRAVAAKRVPEPRPLVRPM
jgi:threonine dehydrogenase-like Zn-dependent dehydrogenase